MTLRLFAACAGLALAAASHAAAQDADTVTTTGQERQDPVDAALTETDGAPDQPQTVAASGGGQATLSYTPDYFAPYNPASAADMVSRVPGFSIDAGGNARGFGQNAGNVLINGERPSTKSQSIYELLGRIAVSEVVRIDLIRGQVAGVDMGGQSVVVNVIRRAQTSSGSWRAEAMYDATDDRVRPSGEISRSFSLLGANASASASYSTSTNANTTRQYILDPAGNALQLNRQRSHAVGDSWGVSLNGDRQIGAWQLRVNARYREGDQGTDSVLERVAGAQKPAMRTGGALDFLRNDVELNHFTWPYDEWEIGADAERKLGDDFTLKIIALKNRHDETDTAEFTTYNGASGARSVTIFDDHGVIGETVLRSFVTWTPRDTLSVEAGAEGAFNFLDSENQIVGIPSSVSSTRVEEKRAEPYVSALWRARPNLTLDAAVQVEISEITQSGFASRARSFTYPKGSASLTWDARETTQFRLTADRSVGQLSFFDFQRSVNLQNDTTNAGNPDLVPEQITSLNATVEQRFWDDGVVSFELRRDWIEDAQGQVPLSGGGEGPGSLGDADRFLVRISLDTPLDKVGVANGRLQLSYRNGESEVTDPVTGRERGLGPRYRGFDIDFRKDYPAAGLSWGLGYSTNSGRKNYRLTEVSSHNPNHGGFGAFVETTRFFGVKIRLAANNVGNFYYDQVRDRYLGRRDTEPLGVTEWTRQHEDYNLELRVTGSW